MSDQGKTAVVTGGASGIGRAVTEMLVKRGIKVRIADINHSAAQTTASEINKSSSTDLVSASTDKVDVASWESQVSAFEDALKDLGGRIDYVFPIAGVGEKPSIINDPSKKSGFEKPALVPIEVNLTGVIYTLSLAVQQFRRQEVDGNGFRGKIVTTASICGLYCVPTLPIYTAAKHGVVGLTRSYGAYLPREQITFNAVCPNVVRTAISSQEFYNTLEPRGLLTEMKDVVDAFESVLGDSKDSGCCLECGPNPGFHKRDALPYLDDESRVVCEELDKRAGPLHAPKSQT